MKRIWGWVFALAAFSVAACLEYPKKEEPEPEPKMPELQQKEPPAISPPEAVGKGSKCVPGCDPTTPTEVLWLVRMDRNLANLAASYETMVGETEDALRSRGFVIRNVSVGSLYDGQLAWTRGVSTLSLRGALQEKAAAAAPNMPAACPSTRMAELMSALDQALLTSKASGGGPVEGARPFHEPAGALLVIVADHADRTAQWTDAACNPQGVSPAQYFAASPHASWLNFASGGWNLLRPQVRFVFLATSEGTQVSFSQERERCAAAGVKGSALDAIEPSDFVFYDPFAAGMNAYSAGIATRGDLCDAIGGGFKGRLGELAGQWRPELEALAQ